MSAMWRTHGFMSCGEYSNVNRRAILGAFARIALENPVKFNRKNIDLAAEAPTMGEVAATLNKVLATRVVAVELTPQQAVAGGLFPGWVNSQEWSNEVGYRADIDALKA